MGSAASALEPQLGTAALCGHTPHGNPEKSSDTAKVNQQDMPEPYSN
jgi:hypothetical protein